MGVLLMGRTRELLIAGYIASRTDLLPSEQRALHDVLRLLLPKKKTALSAVAALGDEVLPAIRASAQSPIAAGDVVFLSERYGCSRYLVIGVPHPDGAGAAVGLQIWLADPPNARYHIVHAPDDADWQARISGDLAARVREKLLRRLAADWRAHVRTLYQPRIKLLSALTSSPSFLPDPDVPISLPDQAATARYLSVLGALYLKGFTNAAALAARIDAVLAAQGIKPDAAADPDSVFRILLWLRYQLQAGDLLLVEAEHDADGTEAGHGAARKDGARLLVVREVFADNGRLEVFCDVIQRKDGKWTWIPWGKLYAAADLMRLNPCRVTAEVLEQVRRDVAQAFQADLHRELARHAHVQQFLRNPAAYPLPQILRDGSSAYAEACA